MSVQVSAADLAEAWSRALSSTKDLNLNDDVFKTFIDDIQYQGLDPARIAHIVLTRGNKKKNVKEEILKLVIMGIERGNKISAMYERSTDTVKRTINQLKDTYQIVDTAGHSLSAVTLSRVALAFPHLACEYSVRAINRTVPVHSLPENYPLEMTHSAFAGLIPTKNVNVKNNLVQILLYYQVQFSLVVDKEAKKKTYREIKEKTVKYVEAGCNSQYIPQEQRIEYLVRWGILLDKDTLTPNTIEVRAKVEELFVEMEQEDRAKFLFVYVYIILF